MLSLKYHICRCYDIDNELASTKTEFDLIKMYTERLKVGS